MNKINRNYIELVKELSFTDFKLKYQGSLLGYLWSLMKPLLFFLVLYVVFTKFLKIGTSIEHYPVYLLLGIVVWGFFAEITAASLDSIVSKGDLIRKVYFPRIILVISRGTTSFMTFALNFFVVLAFMFFAGIYINLNIVLVLALFLELLILSIGIGFFLSALFVRYRDISHIWEVVLQAFFYATPILYPLSFVPQSFAKILMMNPVAQIIQDARYFLITTQAQTVWNTVSWKYAWIPYVIPFIVFLAGYRLFNKSAAKFAEEV